MENLDHKVLDKFSRNFAKILLENDAIYAKQYVELCDMHLYDRIMAISGEKDFHINFNQLISIEDAEPDIRRFQGELYVELKYSLIRKDSEVEYIHIRRQNIFGFWYFKRISETEFIANAKTEDGCTAEMQEEGSAYFSVDFVNKIIIIDNEKSEALWKKNPLYLPSSKNYQIKFSVTEVKRVGCYAVIEAKDYEQAQDIARYLRNEIDDVLCDSYSADVNDLKLLDIPVYSLKNDSSDISVQVISVEEDES